MLDAGWLLLLLLPVAAASGWYLRGRVLAPEEKPATVHPDYLRGISYLVDEDADRAIEVFVRLLEVDNETVETHLALGNLFRKQGEVDRALRLHQNLVARPNLKPIHRNQARFELAQDYLRAGVLDRAEDLFKELAEQGMFLERALSGLVTIHESGRDWDSAIETTRRLETVRGHSLRPVIAQYYCEMAEQARDRGDGDEARRLARAALSEFRECVRASIILGHMAMAEEQYDAAIKDFSRVLKQDIDFVPEILGPLQQCHAARDDLKGFRKLLRDIIRKYPGSAPQVALADLMVQGREVDEAIEHLSGFVQDTPNWVGFYHLLKLTAEQSDLPLSGPMQSLHAALKQIIDQQPTYLCGHCGFSGHYRHWQCPSCKLWNSIIPVRDIKPAG